MNYLKMLACKDRQATGDTMNKKTNCEILKIDMEVKTEGYENEYPLYFVVSKKEFEELQAEHAPEVEGLSYDEYCELESECWNEMLKEQLKEPWEKILPEYLLNPVPMVIARKKLPTKPVLRRMILKSIIQCDSKS